MDDVGMPLALALTAISCFVLIRMFVKDTTPIPLDFLANKNEMNSAGD